MTVSEEIIRWLKDFDQDLLKKINTDLLEPEQYSYMLAKEPVINVKSYISGKKIYTEHYTMLARLPSQYNSQCVDNRSFGDRLEEWVRQKEKDKEYPEIESARVQEMDITTPFYVASTENGNSIYQMTIMIKYAKEA